MRTQSPNIIHALDAHSQSLGVLATRGHLASNGGIRGHSAGATFPYVVFAYGTPTALKWGVREPNGTEHKDCDSSQEAEDLAIILKYSFD
ncbi:p10-like protein [Vibrio phage CHOED]|uniref:p10-like protein n=1 Tax=Vibrio phage CHOED TaxID=1458716 RepID=UPI00042E3149|nr:p10-like protein [Vibrio phage CHOED]AHK11941.1 p10-like protein [Vibrio phage CHOED]